MSRRFPLAITSTFLAWAVLVLAVVAQQDQGAPPPPVPIPTSNQTSAPTQTNATTSPNATAPIAQPPPRPGNETAVPSATNQTAAPIAPGPAPPANVTTNQTGPIAPPPPRPGNVTVPINQTAAPGPVPLPPTNRTTPSNITAAPPQKQPPSAVNQTNATTGPVVAPIQNVTGNVTGSQRPTPPPVRAAPQIPPQTAAPATVMPTSVGTGGIITPSVAQQQTTAPGQSSPGLNANDVVTISGWNGTIVDGGETLILKLPRSQQLDLRVQNIFVPGAGCIATFRPLSDGNVNFMSELLLLDDEIQPVLRFALSAGLDVTALHTHFLFDQPRVYFLHLHGGGIAPQTAAAALRNVTNTLTGIRANPPQPAAPAIETRTSALTLQPIQAALAPSGLSATKQDDGTVLMTASPLTCTVMGFNTSFTTGCQSHSTFAGSDGDSIVYGQFCSNEFNLQRVLVNVLLHNLSVTSIVNHFVGDNPEILFVHFWGRGPAQTLASNLAQIVNDAFRTQ